MSPERYIKALERIRDQISNGSRLRAVDSTTIGDKYISCSWGLCSLWKEQWPDEVDWLRDYGDNVSVKDLSVG